MKEKPFTKSYHSNWAGRGHLPGAASKGCCGQWSIAYLVQLQIELLFLQVHGLVQAGLLCGLPCHRKSGIKLAKKGAIRHWDSRVLRAHLPCATKASSWLWQRESSFTLRNMPEGGTHSMFCRPGCKALSTQLGLWSSYGVMEVWQRELSCHVPYILIVLHTEELPGSWKRVLSYPAKLVDGAAEIGLGIVTNYPTVQGKVSLCGFERKTQSVGFALVRWKPESTKSELWVNVLNTGCILIPLYIHICLLHAFVVLFQ